MPRNHAFTRTELIAVLVAVVALVAIGVGLLSRLRAHVLRLADSTQVRSIHQGIELFAQNNPAGWPIPSRLDQADVTLPADAPKDLPRHLVSILINMGLISPNVCVSVAEKNPAIRRFENYAFSSPAATMQTKLAVWDPAFTATPLDLGSDGKPTGIGHCSYAFRPWIGARSPRKHGAPPAVEAVLGNRGPSYTGGGIDPARTGEPLTPWTLLPNAPTGSEPGGVGSFTLRIHGPRRSWEGVIAYGDGHVEFEISPDPRRSDHRGAPLPLDNLFVNENDKTRLPDSETLEGAAGENTNNFLRLWYDATVTNAKTTAIKPWYD